MLARQAIARPRFVTPPTGLRFYRGGFTLATGMLTFIISSILALLEKVTGGFFFSPVFFCGGLLLLLLLLCMKSPEELQRRAQLQRAAQGFQACYGLQLSEDSLERLSYPRAPIASGTALPPARITIGLSTTPAPAQLFISCEKGELLLRRKGTFFSPELTRATAKGTLHG